MKERTNWTKSDNSPHLSHASPTISDLINDDKGLLCVWGVGGDGGGSGGGEGDLKQTHLKCGKYPRRLESSKMRES